MVWDPINKRLYVSVPSYALNYANSVVAVDPVSGQVTGSQTMPGTPDALAISGDSSYLYVAIDSPNIVQRITLPSLSPDIQIPLGNLPGLTNTPAVASDIQVAPGNPHRIAMFLGTLAQGDTSGGLVLFDDATQRGVPFGGDLGLNGALEFESFTWGANQSTLYTITGYSLVTMTAGTNGISVASQSDPVLPNVAVTQYSSTTGLLYAQTGVVINPSTDTVVGAVHLSNTNGPTNIAAVYDSTLNRIYSPEVGPTPNIQVFDGTSFNLIEDTYLPSNNYPTNPVGPAMRWGSAGLAILLKASVAGNTLESPGSIMIVDGPVVNPNATPDETAGTSFSLTPILTSVSPALAIAGSSDMTATITGANFVSGDNVEWYPPLSSGLLPTWVPATYVSPTQLTVQIPASLLANVSLNSFNVGDITLAEFNAGTGPPPSNLLNFEVYDAPPTGVTLSAINLSADDIAWDPNAQEIYASVGTASPITGNSIVAINPSTLQIASSVAVPGNPGWLRLSDDDQYLYTALDDLGSVTRLKLPGFATDITWQLGGSATLFEGPYNALDLQVAPGQPHTTAITLGYGVGNQDWGGLQIFDDSTPRPQTLPPGQGDMYSLQWGADTSSLYGSNIPDGGDFYQMGVSSTGVVLNTDTPDVFTTGIGIHFDASTGNIYGDDGTVVKASTGTVIGNLSASGLAVVNSSQHRVYILGQTSDQANGTSNYTIEAFDQQTMQSLGSLILTNFPDAPWRFIQWGSSGLAIATESSYSDPAFGASAGIVLILNGDFVGSTSSTMALKHGNVHRTWANAHH